ncbi:unnamed protein product (mitochondrion) [Plasmodiophora brassicae]|uniref:Acyltransferase 3 domain-containing protein n=1 Tax=Plasmodiophora brassicae TaxID=37360 RepID=A0A3P3YMP8_PLABS|nr:unnamed protein product [Plasmodiophora brassicae]
MTSRAGHVDAASGPGTRLPSDEGQFKIVCRGRTPMKATSIGVRGRRVVFIDWMRTIAIYLVVLVHTVVSLRRVTGPETDDLREKINATIRGLLQFGMPLFFYFSGRAATVTAQRGFLHFASSKFMRLIVPLLLGMVFLVLPTSYIGRAYRPCAARSIDGFFAYALDFFTNQIACGGLEWLWFLAVLFALAVVNHPIVGFVSGRYARTPTRSGWNGDDIVPLVTVGCTLAALVAVSTLCHVPHEWTVLIVIPYVVIVLVVSFLDAIRRWHCLPVVFVSCTFLPMLLMAYTKTSGIALHHQVMAFTFYNLFYVEGALNQIFDEEYLAYRQTRVYKAFMPVHLLVMVLLLCLCSPSSDHNIGYLYSFPIYRDAMNCMLYVVGSWNMLMLIVRWGQTFYDGTLNEFLFRHGTKSTIVVYMVHWLFIEIIQAHVVRPYGISLVPALAMTFPLTLMCCWAVYASALCVPFMGIVFGGLLFRHRRPGV